MMKGSSAAGILASVLTASTVALSCCSTAEQYDVVSDDSYIQTSRWSGNREENQRGSLRTEKFGPRFDGLRFIETLITAHR